MMPPDMTIKEMIAAVTQIWEKYKNQPGGECRTIAHQAFILLALLKQRNKDEKSVSSS